MDLRLIKTVLYHWAMEANCLARVLGLEPRITESKSVVLPLHYTRTKTWHPARDSNSHQGFWRPVCCHYTSEIQLWWTDGESNPDLRRAKPLCSRYHYQPMIFKRTVSNACIKAYCHYHHTSTSYGRCVCPVCFNTLGFFYVQEHKPSPRPPICSLEWYRLALPLH